MRPVHTLRPVLTIAALMVLCASGSAVPVRAQVMYPYPYQGFVGPDASVRIQATPKQAEVYVDGYYAGIVDDFDGVFQRLHVAPGQHEITLYLDGYHAVHQNVYLMPDKTFTIKQRLETLGPGDVNEPRPIPPPQTATPPPPQSFPVPRGRGGRSQQPPNFPPPAPPNEPPQSGTASGQGTLSIDLQPPDAEVLIDGQPLSIPQGQGPLMLDLSEGRHVVQVRKQGYIGYLTEVQVRRGTTTPLMIMLRNQQ